MTINIFPFQSTLFEHDRMDDASFVVRNCVHEGSHFNSLRTFVTTRNPFLSDDSYHSHTQLYACLSIEQLIKVVEKYSAERITEISLDMHAWANKRANNPARNTLLAFSF